MLGRFFREGKVRPGFFLRGGESILVYFFRGDSIPDRFFRGKFHAGGKLYAATPALNTKTHESQKWEKYGSLNKTYKKQTNANNVVCRNKRYCNIQMCCLVMDPYIAWLIYSQNIPLYRCDNMLAKLHFSTDILTLT